MRVQGKKGRKGKKVAGFLYHLPQTGFHSPCGKRRHTAEAMKGHEVPHRKWKDFMRPPRHRESFLELSSCVGSRETEQSILSASAEPAQLGLPRCEALGATCSTFIYP